jgi:tetratricopeptide (TPR) repeat protein
MRTILIVALVLIVPAALLSPLERAIDAQRVRMRYGGARVTLDMRDRLGQGMAIGLLAGFRGVVADFLWIQNQGFWQDKEWLRMYRNMELVTTLQPQSILFWDTAQWHMAWNIGYAVRVDPKNRTQAEGLKREREWQEKARDLLARGIENIPNRYELYFSMAWLYAEKFKDVCKAAEYYEQAARFADAPSYVGRFYARALERCGRTTEAYEYWKHLWFQERNRPYQLGSVLEREIKGLEDQLNIPNDQRVFPRPTPGAKAR